MMQYEYRAEPFDTNLLNELGAAGWKAIGVVTDPNFSEHDPTRLVWNTHTVLLMRETVST